MRIVFKLCRGIFITESHTGAEVCRGEIRLIAWEVNASRAIAGALGPRRPIVAFKMSPDGLEEVDADSLGEKHHGVL